MEKKYELTDETIVYDGVTLHRIKALRDFSDVKAGDLGGFIEKENNLSHEGLCWVYDNAIVSGNARVYGDAKVFDNAKVYDHAKVFDNAKVYDQASIYGDATVHGNAMIINNAMISGFSDIYGNSIIGKYAEVYDNAIVCGNISGHANVFDYAEVYNSAISGNAKIFGSVVISKGMHICHDAEISSSNEYIHIGPIGSRDDFTTFYKGKDNIIYVSCGCFSGTLNEFIYAVIKTHKNNEFYKTQYLDTVEFVKKQLGGKI